MKKGEGGVVGQTDSVSPAGITGVRLSVAAPNPIPKDASGNNQTSSVGVFNTALISDRVQFSPFARLFKSRMAHASRRIPTTPMRGR
jgi:hypothetical protein